MDELPPEIAAKVSELLAAMEDLTDLQRMEVVHRIAEGFCGSCGRHQPATASGLGCQCWNDE